MVPVYILFKDANFICSYDNSKHVQISADSSYVGVNLVRKKEKEG